MLSNRLYYQQKRLITIIFSGNVETFIADTLLPIMICRHKLSQINNPNAASAKFLVVIPIADKTIC